MANIQGKLGKCGLTSLAFFNKIGITSLLENVNKSTSYSGSVKEIFMTKQSKKNRLREKIRQALEKLGQTLDEWLPKPRLQPKPVPIDRPYRRVNRKNYR